MKRRIKALLITLIAILVLSSLAVTAFAASSAGEEKSAGVNAVADTSGYSFTYKKGGVTTYAADDKTLADVISLADANSEIVFLKDVFVYSEAAITIDKGLTFNLNGHTLYFSQCHKSYSFFKVITSDPVTMKGGTAIWNVNEYYKKNCTTSLTEAKQTHTSYALFYVQKKDAKLNFYDVKAYGANIVYTYQHTNTTVNIEGGEYHVSYATDMFGNGLLDLRTNATVNISNALIDLTLSKEQTLFTLTHYRETADTKKSVVTLTNCDIISISSDTNVLTNMNGNTTVYFDGCRIFGSIKPERKSNDSVDPKANTIILKGGTLITADGYANSNQSLITLAEDHTWQNVSSYYSNEINAAGSSIFSVAKGTNAANITTSYTNTSFSTTFTLKAKAPLKKYTVTFYEADGVTPLKVLTVEEGSKVTPPAYNADVVSNGWYKVSNYDGWTKEYGTSNKVADFTITDNTAFYPAMNKSDNGLIVNITGASYNLTLTGSITLNFYLPQAPSDITNIKVVTTAGNVIKGKQMVIEEGNSSATYVLYELANLSPVKIAEKTSITVSFTVGGKELSQNFTLSPLKYARGVLEDSQKEKPTWSSETHAIIADMIRYSNELSNAANLGYIAELDALLETYGTLCTPTYGHNNFTYYSGNSANMTALKGYVTSVQFAISDFRPQWIINLDASKRVIDVSISVQGFYPKPDENGVNYGKVVYGLDEENTVRSGGYITTAYIENMPLYNMDGDITITLTISGGTKKSATYNLNSYYSNLTAEGESLNNWHKFLQSFRAFASSSSNYRYSEGKIVQGTVAKDFFECDHANAKEKDFSTTNGQYCSTCQTYIFFYDSYINIPNNIYGGKVYSSRDEAMAGKVNSYKAISYCHSMANNRAGAGYKAGCVATPGAVYYLGYPSNTSGTVDEIPMKTNTQWDGAYIISDESEIEVDDAARSKPLFGIRALKSVTFNGVTYAISGTNVTSYFSSVTSIKAGQTKLPFAPGIPLMLLLTDTSVKHYIRNGANQNAGASQSESILIDEFGNVSNTTPIEWDYTISSSFTVKAYTVTDEHLKLSGLGTDANGNTTYATFENIANNSIDATAYKNVSRNILVRRSNVTVEGIHHELTEDDTNLTPRQAYSGFKVWLGSNVTFKDMSVEQHLNHYIQDTNGNNTNNLLGSYEFGAEDAVGVSWINCRVRNFFNSDGSITYHGLFGTNRVKNMYLRDCFLTSFDAHSGAGNVTIENSTFEHINFIGAGDIILNDVTVYQSTGGVAAIILRQDYGARWRGNVYIDGLELRYDPNVLTDAYIDLVKAFYTNWDFGYGTAAGSNERPANIYANNVSIMEYSRKASRNSTVEFDENGKVIETTLKKGTKKLGIYVNLNKQLTDISRDYSTINSNNKNPMGCTKNIYITNSDVTLQYPTHKFFKNMNIYIDGVKQSWY